MFPSTITRAARLSAALSLAVFLAACGGGSGAPAASGSGGDTTVQGISVPAKISVVTATE